MTPRELAEEARAAFRRKPQRSAKEEIQHLVDVGIIELIGDTEVKVLTAKLFGADDEESGSLPKRSRKKGKKPNQ